MPNFTLKHRGVTDPLKIRTIFFDTTNGGSIPVEEGTLSHNVDDGCLEYGMPGGVALQLGQEQHYPKRVTNGEAVQINNGQAVYISGFTGSNPIAKLASATAYATSLVIAVATENIPAGQKGAATTFGVVRDIKTDYPTWSNNQPLYLDTTSGALTNVILSNPNYYVKVGTIGRVHATEGEIIVDIVSCSPQKLRVGGETNFSDFEADGTLRFNGDATVWEDVNAGSLTLVGPVGLQPGVVEILDNTGTATGIYSRSFDVDELGSTFIEAPHAMKSGSTVYFHVHWHGQDTAPTGTDYVKWEVTFFGVADGETIPAPTTISVETAIDTQYERMDSYFAGTVLVDTFDQVGFTLKRVTAAGDAYASEVVVHTIGIHVEMDTVGSRQVTTK